MAPSYRHLRAADFQAMPWKNGGGSTTELWIEPAGAKVAEPFLWRLSVARMTGSGPFSPFPGVDRTLIQLSGPALRLEHGAGRGSQALTPLVPYGFPGEWATDGILAGGAKGGPAEAMDFNVMVRRGRVVAHTEVLWLAAGRTVSRRADGWAAVYGVEGTLRVGSTETREVTEMTAGELVVGSGGDVAICGEGVAIVVRGRIVQNSRDSKARGARPDRPGC
jgi:environmental stress-induced protein Ves